MKVEEQIKAYIAGQPEAKRGEIQALHELILKVLPNGKLWFTDGKDSDGRIITNPTIGYGLYTIHYANGTTRDFFRIGLLANSTGISVHILGIKDKTYLPTTYGTRLGKASVTGYCIRFKSIKHIHIDVLEEAIRFGAEAHYEE
jgi:hypothetical protein